MARFKILFIAFFLLTSISGISQEKKTIFETLKANPEFSQFVKALEMTGLDEALKNEKSIATVFAPSDRAFNQDKELFNTLFTQNDKELLSQIIGQHIALEQPFGEEEMETVRANAGQEGKEFMIQPIMGRPYQIVPKENIFILISDSFHKVYVVKSDLKNSNGTLHSISRCIIERR